MQNNIYRKESMKKVTSPDQLNDYIKVVNPGIWMILISALIFLAGLCVWGLFGHLDTKLQAVGITEGDATVCYVKEEDISNVEVGMEVYIGEEETTVKAVMSEPVCVDSDFSKHFRTEGDFSVGEWVYCVVLNDTFGEEGEIHNAEIVLETVAPAVFVFN